MLSSSCMAMASRRMSLRIGQKRQAAALLLPSVQQRARRFQFSTSKDDKNSMVPTPTDSNDDIVPIDFNVSAKIEGEESQIVSVKLQPNQKLRAESGAMLYMTSGVQMETTTGAGLSDGFKRMLTGQNLMVSDFSYTGDSSGEVALGTDFPSKIVKLSLEDYDGKLVCQRGAYLASNPSVDIEMEFTKKFSTGFFGGEGFVLQALKGEGDVFVKAGGTLVKKELEAGETLRVSSGSLVAFTSGVEYDIQTMPGFKNVMFGGEGLFVTTLSGPGSVWLQGMPPDRMISEIARRVPAGGIGLGIPIGMGGGGESGAEGEGAEDAAVVAEGGGEEMVAATDAAVEADRQATVASSGAMGSDQVDSESPSALFGDAAGEETSAAASNETDDFGFAVQDDFSSSEPTFQDDSFPEMNDTSSFSTEESDFSSQGDGFKDDTTFSTFEDSSSDPSSSDVFESGSGMGDDEEGGIGGILRTIWDIFTGDD